MTLGYTIQLGHYPPNQPIEWLVLRREPSRILCVSKYLLDCEPYHKTLEGTSWADCTLRAWLNHDFIQAAFTQEEQQRILKTRVENPIQDTKDALFLLSSEEAEEYLGWEERAAETTEYARERGAWFAEDEGQKRGCWWLRYPEGLEDEEEPEEAYTVLSCVNFDGYIEGAAEEINSETCCVRPALWLRIEETSPPGEPYGF